MFKQYRHIVIKLLPTLVTLSQFIGCFFIPLFRQSFKFNKPKNFKVLFAYILLTILVFGATGLATASLEYVSYPTKVVFKSIKLIPTMIFSTFLNKKMYYLKDYIAAWSLCIGKIQYQYIKTN